MTIKNNDSVDESTLRLERALRHAKKPTGKSPEILQKDQSQLAPQAADAVKVSFNHNNTLTELATYSRPVKVASAEPADSEASARREKVAKLKEKYEAGTLQYDSTKVAEAFVNSLSQF